MKQQHYNTFRKEVEGLLKSLKRSCLDPECRELEVTIGVTSTDEGLAWNYQTGDNSFTGGAYGHPHWVTTYLTPRSNCRELSTDVMQELKELLS